MIRTFDIFMGFNVALLMATSIYGFANTEGEFGLYAAVMLGIGLVIWGALRRFEFPVWQLVLLEIGLLAHFAGGFTYVDGVSLYYWEGIAGIRFDRIVHFYNSAVGSVVMLGLYRQSGLELGGWEPWIVIMTVFGIGAGVEVIEFVADLLLVETGVGDYANTMEDIAVNAVGAVFGYLLARWAGRGAVSL